MYYSIEQMLEMVDHPANRKPCLKLLKEKKRLFQTVQGSTHNHQAWRGGYWDHIQEAMNIGIKLYRTLDSDWIFRFTLGEALLVLFLHDIEKPWSYELGPDQKLRRTAMLNTKEAQRNFRDKKLKEFGILLTEKQENAMKYVEGEGNDYTNRYRVMNELAAFCHMCDVASARIRHAHPLEKNDPWSGAERLKKLKRQR